MQEIDLDNKNEQENVAGSRLGMRSQVWQIEVFRLERSRRGGVVLHYGQRCEDGGQTKDNEGQRIKI